MSSRTDPELADLRIRIRHSTAHVMAHVVTRMFPETKLAIGPPTNDGFYYDFLSPESISAEDLEEIELRMKEVIAKDLSFEYAEYSRGEAIEMNQDEPLKLEIVEGIPEGEPISTYRHGDFEDLCAGPHVESTGKIPAFRLLNVAGAYWRGDENRPMLQRIYGTAFESIEALEEHLHKLKEAKTRDHRRLGEELGLFTFSEAVGRGLPLRLPAGATIREELESWAKETERKWGYERIVTPHLTRSDLYYMSGHLPYYKDDMYPPMEIEGEEYYLKPMNCPHHHMVFKSRPHSYRELPIRYAEYGTVYRYERSGQLFGMMRVRGLTQNDAHIYCTLDQAKQEFAQVMRLHEYYYKTLGIDDYHMVLALRDPDDDTKYHGDAEMWASAERITREAMEDSGIPFVEELGAAAHYGPKVDFIIKSAIGREFAASTNQLDLYMPERFDLTYIDSDSKKQPVVVIHRAPLGSHERFVAFLIEHYGGAFPTWLAPVQATILTVVDRHRGYAEQVEMQLTDAGIRARIDKRNQRMNAKIRDAQLQKIPHMLIVGDREIKAGSVAVRIRSGEDLGTVPVTEVAERIAAEISSRN